MTQQRLHESAYTSSHALVIGIDRYEHVGPLSFAANDARAIANTLINCFDFPAENVILLIDSAATRSAITSAYLRLSQSDIVRPDDRLLIFFAGHGHTATGRRGETGFLVPVDGKVSDLATLVKWSELTGSADLILAKHIFFLMDACYGGLAVTRKPIPPGSARLLNDMLQRFARQVLTAGKANQTVSDGGGARPGHSIFTSHVLDALDGAASVTKGVITANGVMAYVYEKVGSDLLSNQTPHYGFLEGDGDFIFSPLITPSDSEKIDNPVLIHTPSFSDPEAPPAQAESVSDTLKRLIAQPSEKIRLNDFVMAQTRHSIQNIGLDKFPVQGSYSVAEFAQRLGNYENVLSNLLTSVVLLAYWAQTEQISLIEKIFARLAETNKLRSGVVAWNKLGWYPLHILMYAGGIAALSEGRFDTLHSCLLTPVTSSGQGQARVTEPIVIPAGSNVSGLNDSIKSLPGQERRYTPRSDYLFRTLQSA